jgi:hypothetical protein
MREGTWEYEVVARCALADAVALLSDPERQGALHPLITKVVPEPPQAGALRSYAITDALRWGPMRFRITYHADVLEVSDSRVVTIARQRPRTTLRSTTRFTPDGETVRIGVTVRLQAPTPLFAYAFRTGRSAHLELADRLREVLEGPAPAR